MTKLQQYITTHNEIVTIESISTENECNSFKDVVDEIKISSFLMSLFTMSIFFLPMHLFEADFLISSCTAGLVIANISLNVFHFKEPFLLKVKVLIAILFFISVQADLFWFPYGVVLLSILALTSFSLRYRNYKNILKTFLSPYLIVDSIDWVINDKETLKNLKTKIRKNMSIKEIEDTISSIKKTIEEGHKASDLEKLKVSFHQIEKEILNDKEAMLEVTKSLTIDCENELINNLSKKIITKIEDEERINKINRFAQNKKTLTV